MFSLRFFLLVWLLICLAPFVDFSPRTEDKEEED